MTQRERKNSVVSESAVLVGVMLPENADYFDDLEELKGLATAAGTEVVGKLIQRRDKPDTHGYLGKGKVEELSHLVKATDADVVIFDNDLSPGQVRNLEQETDVKVLDRTELILDIFASHAQTYESRLAVELAQLEYSLPRLKNMWSHLSRMKMGVGMRGPGEKQLEFDRRLVEKRIHDLKTELSKIEKRKERQVAARSDHMTVSLVGYTNAGKSTLMNRLTDADVKAQDQLFATLDTRTRRWHLPNWGPVLLSDTVGFIRDLPHRLVTSFKATLEETVQSDLLLHVADVSNPAVLDQIAAVFDVLEDLGIEEKDAQLIVNKVDACEDESRVQSVLNRYPNAVVVSAYTGEGMDRLATAVSDALSRSFVNVDIDMSVMNGKMMAFVAAHGDVLSKQFDEERVRIHCRMPQKYLGRIHDPDVKVTERKKASAEETTNKEATSEQAANNVVGGATDSLGVTGATDAIENLTPSQSGDTLENEPRIGDVA